MIRNLVIDQIVNDFFRFWDIYTEFSARLNTASKCQLILLWIIEEKYRLRLWIIQLFNVAAKESDILNNSNNPGVLRWVFSSSHRKTLDICPDNSHIWALDSGAQDVREETIETLSADVTVETTLYIYKLFSYTLEKINKIELSFEEQFPVEATRQFLQHTEFEFVLL